MGRVINLEGAGKERNKLVKTIVLAMRELMRQPAPDEHSRDLAAYIATSLLEINETVEAAVGAWEKKGHWVKADRFRMDWQWSGRLGNTMREAVLKEDWGTVAMTAAQVAERLKDVDVPKRHGLGEPWMGARKKLV